MATQLDPAHKGNIKQCWDTLVRPSVCLSHAVRSKQCFLWLWLLRNTNRKPNTGRQTHWSARLIRNKSAPIQLSQCRFPLLAISNGKILVRFFSKNKIYGSSFIKQHSETDMVWNYQNTDCSLREKNYCVIYYNFRHTFVPYIGIRPTEVSISFSPPLGQ